MQIKSYIFKINKESLQKDRDRAGRVTLSSLIMLSLRFSANITTLAAPPSQPPANLGGGGGKVGVLTITWDPLPLASQNGPGVGYVVNWKEANMVDEQWDEVSRDVLFSDVCVT